MQQLTMLDSMFVAMDTDTSNAILGGLLLFDPAPDGRTAPDENFMRARITERAKYLPPLSRRVIRAPLGLGHDYLGVFDRLDVSAHLRTIHLPSPGTHEQLAEEVSRQMSAAKLPEDRPLWDYTIIKGLENGAVAHMIRIHHLVIDGGSMGLLYDLLSDRPKMPMTTDVHPYPQPRFGQPEMIVRELMDTARLPVNLAKLGVGLGGWAVDTVKKSGVLGLAATPLRMIPGDFTGPLLGRVNERLKAKGIPEVVPWMPAMKAPDMPFNGRMTSRRTYAFADLPLEDFRRIGKLLGGTINDAVLGVSAGAVRRYLQERRLPANPPLVVNIPVSIRTGEESAKWANYVFMIFAEFPTHLNDPVARVRAASASVKQARASFDALPVKVLPDASKLVHPALLRGPMRIMSTAPDQMQKMHYNLVVSNVRGPSEPMFMDGVRIIGDWPASFLAAGGGLNITLKSYLDKMNFGFMGCPEQTGDLSCLVEYMTESLEETLAAAEAYAAAQESPPARPKRVPRRRGPGGSGGGRLTAVQAPSAREG
jgi:WS/DGAT/MGAT family acyltransferase